MNIGPIILDLLTLKQGIVLMWAVWMSFVVILNVFDALRTAGLLPSAWKFSSGNYWYIQQVTKIYGTPAWVNWVFFVIVIAWEVLSAVLLWVAFAGFDGIDYAMVNAAWVVTLALWGAFIVMDEIFLAWAAEIGNSNAMEAHRSLFVAWLVSLMAIHLLPNV